MYLRMLKLQEPVIACFCGNRSSTFIFIVLYVMYNTYIHPENNSPALVDPRPGLDGVKAPRYDRYFSMDAVPIELRGNFFYFPFPPRDSISHDIISEAEL